MSKQRLPMREYTPEFKSQTGKLVLQQGTSANMAARDLGVPPSTLHGWISHFKKGDWDLDTGLPKNCSGASYRKMADVSEEQQRLKELEHQVKRLTLERDILKKAMAYFMEQPK